jgi:hypothetical protein
MPIVNWSALAETEDGLVLALQDRRMVRATYTYKHSRQPCATAILQPNSAVTPPSACWSQASPRHSFA